MAQGHRFCRFRACHRQAPFLERSHDSGTQGPSRLARKDGLILGVSRLLPGPGWLRATLRSVPMGRPLAPSASLNAKPRNYENFDFLSVLTVEKPGIFGIPHFSFRASSSDGNVSK